MKRGKRPNRGFTLIEALVAVVLLGVGIAAVMGAFASLAKGENRSREVEKMHRLAVDKMAELRATTDTFGANDNGDFSDRNEPDYTWDLQVDPTGTENLDAITITVQHNGNNGDNAPDASITELLFQPPATDDTGGGTGGTTGGGGATP